MTYYDLFKIPKNASQSEVKRAYRVLVKINHPDVDKRPGATERIVEINKAYEVLVDPNKRAAYDAQLGMNPFAQPFMGFRPDPQEMIIQYDRGDGVKVSIHMGPNGVRSIYVNGKRM